MNWWVVILALLTAAGLVMGGWRIGNATAVVPEPVPKPVDKFIYRFVDEIIYIQARQENPRYGPYKVITTSFFGKDTTGHWEGFATTTEEAQFSLVDQAREFREKLLAERRAKNPPLGWGEGNPVWDHCKWFVDAGASQQDEHLRDHHDTTLFGRRENAQWPSEMHNRFHYHREGEL